MTNYDKDGVCRICGSHENSHFYGPCEKEGDWCGPKLKLEGGDVMPKKKKTKVVTNIPPKPVKEEAIVAVDKPTSITIVEPPYHQVAPEPEVVVEEPSEYLKWLDSAPVARGNLTQRWYGETFIPEYKAWLEEGKKFDK